MTTTRGRAYKVCSQFLSFSLYLLTNLALLPSHLTALRAWLPMPMETTTAAAAAGDANEDAKDDNQLQLPTMPHCHIQMWLKHDAWRVRVSEWWGVHRTPAISFVFYFFYSYFIYHTALTDTMT